MMDPGDEGRIALRQFHQLIKTVRSSLTTNEIRVVFDLVDKDKSSSIDVDEFLALCDVLLIRFSLRRVSANQVRCCRVSWCRPIVDHWAFEWVCYMFILANLVVVVMQSTSSVRDSPTAIETLGVIEIVLVVWFGIEMVIKVGGLGFFGYIACRWNCFDALLTIASIIGLVVQLALTIQLGSNVATLRVLRALRLLRTARTLTVLSHTKKLHPIVRTFMLVMPMFMSLSVVLGIFMNLFAILGTEMFGAESVQPDGALCAPMCGDFTSWPYAMLSLIQIIVGNGWVTLMYQTMNAMLGRGWSQAAAWSTSLYFMTFFVMVELLFINLLGALTIEIYLVEIEKMRDNREEDQLLATLFGDPKVKALPAPSPRLCPTPPTPSARPPC